MNINQARHQGPIPEIEYLCPGGMRYLARVAHRRNDAIGHKDATIGNRSAPRAIN